MNIGDKVKVVNSGSRYTTYGKMAKLMKATNYKDRTYVENGEVGIVKCIKFHLDSLFLELALVDFGDKEIIIGTDGLKVISREEIIYN